MNAGKLLTPFVLALGFGLAGTSHAGDVVHAGSFVCGMLAATNDRILGGDYRTQFNILNVSSKDTTVDLTLALTFPADAPVNGEPFTPGQVLALQSVDLEPGEAVMIDCLELGGAAAGIGNPPPTYFAGVLSIQSRRSLSVTHFQTAGANAEDVSSVAVTQIEGVEQDNKKSRNRD